MAAASSRRQGNRRPVSAGEFHPAAIGTNRIGAPRSRNGRAPTARPSEHSQGIAAADRHLPEFRALQQDRNSGRQTQREQAGRHDRDADLGEIPLPECAEHGRGCQKARCAEDRHSMVVEQVVTRERRPWPEEQQRRSDPEIEVHPAPIIAHVVQPEATPVPFIRNRIVGIGQLRELRRHRFVEAQLALLKTPDQQIVVVVGRRPSRQLSHARRSHPGKQGHHRRTHRRKNDGADQPGVFCGRRLDHVQRALNAPEGPLHFRFLGNCVCFVAPCASPSTGSGP